VTGANSPTSSRGLSVIIPVYGNVLTLQRTLDSVDSAAGEDAGDFPIEIVVVFDGLIDASDELVAAWKPKSPRATLSAHHIEHGGIGHARNAGIKNAQFELLTFLDADDELTPARLALVRLDDQAPDEVVIGVQSIRVENNASIPGPYVPTSVDVPRRPQYYATSMLVRRATMLSINGFDETYAVGDDIDLVMRLTESGVPVRMVDDIVVLRYFHGANASYDEQVSEGDFFKAIRGHMRRIREQDDGVQGH